MKLVKPPMLVLYKEIIALYYMNENVSGAGDFMFFRKGDPIMSFRVYDGYGNCISDYTGTLEEWQAEVAPRLPGSSGRTPREKRLRLVE